jgi:NhaA family Na+:H+ antiporter
MMPVGRSDETSLLHKLEHALHKPVAFFVIPLFGFANAGVSFYGVTADVLRDTLTTGVAGALVAGKVIGVMGAVFLAARGWGVKLPEGANWRQMFGISLLCGIGFTMSLFIALLAFTDPALQDRVKFGILAGSAIAAVLGYTVLRLSAPKKR